MRSEYAEAIHPRYQEVIQLLNTTSECPNVRLIIYSACTRDSFKLLLGVVATGNTLTVQPSGLEVCLEVGD